MKHFFGKYRGKVENNLDPMQQGRVQVSVPTVLGSGKLSWAMPCVPFAGPSVGFFAIPPSGANVWVEFEGGDPNFPIWSGCFWGVGEVPALPAVEQMKVWKTDAITLTFSDLPGIGGVTLEVNPPAVPMPMKLVFDVSGIELSTGASSVKLTPVSVSVNNGALEVI
ncbi:MAG TPA: phage baseplate assembly protein V [Chloroflexota bacterium]|nr:phage baseplate assembly protein V [Chloroflexota bacterium]